MKKSPYLIDDRCIIPEYIKKMTPEQLDAEIARLEKEARQNKLALLRGDTNKKQTIRDKYIIPDDIKAMTVEELDAEIARFERNAAEELDWAV